MWSFQSGKRHATQWAALYRLLSRQYSSNVPDSLAVPLSVAAYQVWGANTDVGKTLISAGLMKQAIKGSQVTSVFLSIQATPHKKHTLMSTT